MLPSSGKCACTIDGVGVGVGVGIGVGGSSCFGGGPERIQSIVPPMRTTKATLVTMVLITEPMTISLALMESAMKRFISRAVMVGGASGGGSVGGVRWSVEGASGMGVR